MDPDSVQYSERLFEQSITFTESDKGEFTFSPCCEFCGLRV